MVKHSTCPYRKILFYQREVSQCLQLPCGFTNTENLDQLEMFLVNIVNDAALTDAVCNTKFRSDQHLPTRTPTRNHFGTYRIRSENPAMASCPVLV